MNETQDFDIELSQLQIKLDNPRHEKKEDVQAALRELVDKEKVVELACDIASIGGINPMDRIGVVQDPGSPPGMPVFISAEGNRRVAALMLLDDPERLPPDVNSRGARLRRLKSASTKLDPMTSVRVVVFQTFEDADPWIDRMHVSGSDGARKSWNATQQARRHGQTGNVNAVALIDAARKAKIITAEERDRIAPTNVQRIVGSRSRRAQLGLTGTGSELRRTIPWLAFEAGLEKLMRDQLDQGDTHNSRALNTADKLDHYVLSIVRTMGAPARLPNGETRPLMPTRAEQSQGSPGAYHDHDESNPGEQNEADGSGSGQNARGATQGSDQRSSLWIGDNNLPNGSRGGTIARVAELEVAIKDLGNQNLLDLYVSLTTVSARQHAMLICIGCSTLLELLATAAGWSGKSRLVDYVIGKSEVREKYSEASIGSVSDILRGFRARANLGKHDVNAGGVHGDALIRDMATLEGVFVAVAQLAVKANRAED